MTNRNLQAGRGCVLESRSCALSSDFGLQLFMRKAGVKADEILRELGTYKSGPRKGLQKGFIHWIKVVEGGWHREYGVLRGGCIEFCVSRGYNEAPDIALSGKGD